MVTTHVSIGAFRERALAEPDARLELVDGQIREKPQMSAEHNDLIWALTYLLNPQIDPRRYRGRTNAGRVQRSESTAFIPDFALVSVEMESEQRRGPGHLEVYTRPLPLVVEIWSPSTDDYDVMAKLPTYQERGDAEIWLPHPYERTLTAWARQPDGGYVEHRYGVGDIVALSAIPGVQVDLRALFEL